MISELILSKSGPQSVSYCTSPFPARTRMRQHPFAPAARPVCRGRDDDFSPYRPPVFPLWSFASSSGQVDRRRRPVVETLVQALLIVKPEISVNPSPRLRHRFVVL